VVAAIILWNTVYLERAIAALEKQGKPVREDLIPHISPQAWEHINLTGITSGNSVGGWPPVNSGHLGKPGSENRPFQKAVQFFPFGAVTPKRLSNRRAGKSLFACPLYGWWWLGVKQK
jgi:hypothetical protein